MLRDCAETLLWPSLFDLVFNVFEVTWGERKTAKFLQLLGFVIHSLDV